MANEPSPIAEPEPPAAKKRATPKATVSNQGRRRHQVTEYSTSYSVIQQFPETRLT